MASVFPTFQSDWQSRVETDWRSRQARDMKRAQHVAGLYAGLVEGRVLTAGTDWHQVKRGDLVLTVRLEDGYIELWPHFADQVADLHEWRLDDVAERVSFIIKPAYATTDEVAAFQRVGVVYANLHADPAEVVAVLEARLGRIKPQPPEPRCSCGEALIDTETHSVALCVLLP